MDDPIRVLVVEDNQDIRHILKLKFERAGFEVQTTSESIGAAAIATVFDPAIVVLDILMPGKDGLQVAEEIRKTSAVPIVFLTGVVDEEIPNRAYALGAHEVIAKPIKMDELIARLREIVAATRNVDEVESRK